MGSLGLSLSMASHHQNHQYLYDYKRCSGQSSVPLINIQEKTEPLLFPFLRFGLIVFAMSLLIFVMIVFCYLIMELLDNIPEDLRPFTGNVSEQLQTTKHEYNNEQ